MAEKRALSRHQFAESGFDTSGYAFNEIPGLHTAIIDCKRWGKHKLVTYFTFDDGRKVVAPTATTLDWRSYRLVVKLSWTSNTPEPVS